MNLDVVYQMYLSLNEDEKNEFFNGTKEGKGREGLSPESLVGTSGGSHRGKSDGGTGGGGLSHTLWHAHAIDSWLR